MRKEGKTNLISDERILEQLDIEPLHESDAILWILFWNKYTTWLVRIRRQLQDRFDTQMEKEREVPFHRKGA